MTISEQTFLRYAVIRETFNHKGECTSHQLLMETDNREAAQGTAELERRKPVKNAGELPLVYMIDRMTGETVRNEL